MCVSLSVCRDIVARLHYRVVHKRRRRSGDLLSSFDIGFWHDKKNIHSAAEC